MEQIKGLPIGPRATSGIARIVMNELDEMVGKELERLMIELDIHIIYMDDIRMLLKRMIAGTILVDGKLLIDPEVARSDSESENPEIEATTRFLRDLSRHTVHNGNLAARFPRPLGSTNLGHSMEGGEGLGDEQ